MALKAAAKKQPQQKQELDFSSNCQYCNKSFANRSGRSTHELYCTEKKQVSEVKFKCRKCLKSFAGLQGRNAHEYHCKINSSKVKNSLKRKAESCQVWVAKMSKNVEKKYPLPKELLEKVIKDETVKRNPILPDDVDDPEVSFGKSGQEDRDSGIGNGTESEDEEQMRRSRSGRKLTFIHKSIGSQNRGKRTPNSNTKKVVGKR